MPKRHRALVAIGLAVMSLALHADERERMRMRTPPPPRYVQECGACHAPYPAGLLPAASWQRLMGNLPNHYGTDASLEADTQARLAAWLAAGAGTGKRVDTAPPEDRITRSAWFERKHRRVPDAVWRGPSVRSASNCSACHREAAAGRFNEHDIVMPR